MVYPEDRGFIFLKQTILLPGITRVQTTMISMGRARNLAFKQAQCLPTLTSELLVNSGTKAEGNFWQTAKPSPAIQSAPTPAESARLPLPVTSVPVAEQVVFTIIALSAAMAAGQALFTMISAPQSWPVIGALFG